MSTTANGYIIDVTDDEGVAIIPAPPSPQNQKTSISNYCAGTVTDSIESSCPTRDSVSAAIALVRAKQVAKSAILRTEELVLQPRSVSSDQTTSTSNATESSVKDKVVVGSENAAPVVSQKRDNATSASKVPIETQTSNDFGRQINQKSVNSTSSTITSLTQGPSSDQTPDQLSTTCNSASDEIPGPPSFSINESDDAGFNEAVDANTIEDVNNILTKLGVGTLHSTSNGSNNSIDRMRLLSSGSGGGSSDGMESKCSSVRKVQPETLAEISAIMDAVAKEHGEREGKEEMILPDSSMETENNSCTRENDDAHVRPTRTSPIYELLENSCEDSKDPPSNVALETQNRKTDPPGPSKSLTPDMTTTHPSPVSIAAEEERNTHVCNGNDMQEEELANSFVDKSYSANVLKTLSTVKEVTSMEVEDDEVEDDDSVEKFNDEHNTDGSNQSETHLSPKQDIDNAPESPSISAMASEEQESVYGADGRKEPKGIYKKDEVEVEKIPVSTIGAEQSITNNMSLMTIDTQHPGNEQHTQHETSSRSKGFATVDTFDNVSDTGSLPWAIRDVASEETLRATGRRRPHFVVSGPRPSNKSRNVASLFDDESQQASETASELCNNVSYGSDDRSNDSPIKENEVTEIESSDSVEADRCIVDTLLYNDYDKNSDDSGDMHLEENSEVKMMSQDQLEEVSQKNQEKTPNSQNAAVVDDQNTTEAEEKSARVVTKTEGSGIGENSSSSGIGEPSYFLRQIEDFDLKDETEADTGEQITGALDSKLSDIRKENHTDPMSPMMLVNYFLNVDKRKFQGKDEEMLARDFKRLIMPVIKGKKPTIVEEAQLRQAALKADVPLDFVDAFVEYVRDENPKVEEIENLNEDDAIAAFLSSKLGGCDSEKGKLCKTEDNSDFKSSQEKADISGETNPDINKSEDLKSNCLTESGARKCKTNEDTISVPKVVETNSASVDTEPVVCVEMVNACKSIQRYDKSIWKRRTAMATHGWEWEEATSLSAKSSQKATNSSRTDPLGVTASKDVSNSMFNKKSFPLARKRCKLSYDRRVEMHKGYFDVDVYSLQECATFGEENLYRDETPWECRNVRQRFLHERSLTFSRNWFGDLVKTIGNDKVKAPICKPKSMEMPMPKIPDPGDWTPEWYTTWGGRKLLLRRPSADSSDDSSSDSDTDGEYCDKDSVHSYSTGSRTGSSYGDDEDWEDAPECGTFVNTKLKIGEHVSRVHPDHTSSLRKSRWRRKYFPAGTFPY